jgi:hypothetical protein
MISPKGGGFRPEQIPLPDRSRGQASWAQAVGTSGDFDYDLDYVGRDC